MATFEHNNYIPVNSNTYHNFAIKEIDNTENTDMCKIHCDLEVNCDISTYDPLTGRCQLGLFTNGVAELPAAGPPAAGPPAAGPPAAVDPAAADPAAADPTAVDPAAGNPIAGFENHGVLETFINPLDGLFYFSFPNYQIKFNNFIFF